MEQNRMSKKYFPGAIPDLLAASALILAAATANAPDLIRGKVYPVLRVTEIGDYIIADGSGEDWTYNGEDFVIVLADGESVGDGVVQLRLGEKEEKRGDLLRAIKHYSQGIALGCTLCGDAMLRCYDAERNDNIERRLFSAHADEPGMKEHNEGFDDELWAGMVYGYSPDIDSAPEEAALKTEEAAEHYRKAAEQGNVKATAALIHLLSASLAKEAYEGECRDLLTGLEEAEI